MSRSASAGVMSAGVTRGRRRFSWGMSAPPFGHSIQQQPNRTTCPTPWCFGSLVPIRDGPSQCQYPPASRSFRLVSWWFRTILAGRDSVVREYIQELRSAGQRCEVALGQRPQATRQDAHAAGSSSVEERLAATGGGDSSDASVIRIGDASNEPHAFESAHEVRHGGRPDLL